MQRNVDLNFPQHKGTATGPLKIAELDWGGELPEDLPHNPEIILAADCVYFEVGISLSHSLAHTTDRFYSACVPAAGGYPLSFSADRGIKRDLLLLEEAEKGKSHSAASPTIVANAVFLCPSGGRAVLQDAGQALQVTTSGG